MRGAVAHRVRSVAAALLLLLALGSCAATSKTTSGSATDTSTTETLVGQAEALAQCSGYFTGAAEFSRTNDKQAMAAGYDEQAENLRLAAAIYMGLAERTAPDAQLPVVDEIRGRRTAHFADLMERGLLEDMLKYCFELETDTSKAVHAYLQGRGRGGP